MKKSTKRGWIAAFALGLMAVVCSAFAFASPVTKTANAMKSDTVQMLDLSKDLVLTDASTLTAVNGQTTTKVSSSWGLPVSQNGPLTIATATGSNGTETSVLRMGGFHGLGLRTSKGVKFTREIATSEILSLAIKIYIDFSTSEADYSTDYGGVRIFSLDATGASGEGYMIPRNTQQRQWVTLTVDPSVLADTNGNLSGLQFGSVVHMASLGITDKDAQNAKFYTNTTTASPNITNNSAYLYIESVTVTTVPKVEIGDELAMLDFSKDLVTTTTTLTKVNGKVGSNVGAVNTAETGPEIITMVGSNGTEASVLQTQYHGYGRSVGKKAVVFEHTIPVEDIHALQLVVYADLNPASSTMYEDAYGGVRLFGLGATGEAGEGYKIPRNIQQREWVTLTLTGDDLAKLADADGNLSGLQYGSIENCGNSGFYSGGNPTAKIFFESITAVAADNALKSVNVALEDEIAMKFHYELADKFAGSEEAYVNFTVAGEESQVPVSEATVDANGRYVFEYRLAAAQLTEQITLKFVGGNVEQEFTYSFAEYAKTLLAMESSSAELKALLKATLNYGAYAQTYFEENTSTLANAGLLAEEIEAVEDVDSVTGSVLTAEGAKPEGVLSVSYDLRCKSATVMKLYVTLEEGENVSDYTFTIDGESVSVETVGANKYVYTITGIAAAELDKTFTFGISNDSGSATVTVNAYSYFAGRIADTGADTNLVNLVKAMYLYGEAANAYFGA